MARVVAGGVLVASRGTSGVAGNHGPGLHERTAAGAEHVTVKVVETLPHDPKTSTQGLELAGYDALYEKTGAD
ncbi:glutaminyl-peptide cyclotransferase [Streptomyces sp. NBC_01384]|uniref:glutaminyl-peptide cyclotransferase n=1 Tax=Streptomyces sp. NBC_01384 TaxID=2903847 RepID=UPI00324466FC